MTGNVAAKLALLALRGPVPGLPPAPPMCLPASRSRDGPSTEKRGRGSGRSLPGAAGEGTKDFNEAITRSKAILAVE